jgi:hypothetical protein
MLTLEQVSEHQTQIASGLSSKATDLTEVADRVGKDLSRFRT